MTTSTCESPEAAHSCCGAAPATHTLPDSTDAIKAVVRAKYSGIAEGEAGCGYSMIGDTYEAVDGYVEDADLGLGCGLPVEHANLRSGSIVLDLGSGAGLDAFVARRVVGEHGEVIGLDFSESMVRRARHNARTLGYENVRFVLGDIEHIPLSKASVDVVVSNCVLNLVPDKRAAFREIFRVLRSGGHFTISDVVLEGGLPDEVRRSSEAYVGCVAGALEREAYLALIEEAGFVQIHVAVLRPIAYAPGVLSITVRANKPQDFSML